MAPPGTGPPRIEFPAREIGEPASAHSLTISRTAIAGVAMMARSTGPRTI
jgi:hypothetical protein